MLVVMDESGDPGFKLGRGSTSHFVVAMVRFDDDRAAQQTGACIADLKQRLQINGEIKFSKSPDEVRDQFFAAVRNQEFRARMLVVEKQRLYSERLKRDSDCFYNFFLRLLMSHDHDTLRDARIKVDGSGDRRFKRELASYLRRELAQGKVASLRFVDSRNDNLIQLADMCAGAVLRARRSDDRRDARWMRQLGPRLENVWDFG